MRAPRSQCFLPQMNTRHPWQMKKSKSWGPFWSYSTAKCQFSLFGPVNGLDWQCCLAGSSKTAPRILIFSFAIGVDYSYEVKNSEIWAPTFFKHNNSFTATVVNWHLSGVFRVKISLGNCVFETFFFNFRFIV